MLSCDPDKTPSFDGFNMRFIKEIWDDIGYEITRFVHNFFASGNSHPSINTTWVTLIPKLKQTHNINNYRPINVVGCIYKIISKVLANRVKLVIGQVVDKTQTSFIEGRSIFHGILTATEVIRWMKKKKTTWSSFQG